MTRATAAAILATLALAAFAGCGAHTSCEERVALTRQRLAALAQATPLTLYGRDALPVTRDGQPVAQQAPLLTLRASGVTDLDGVPMGASAAESAAAVRERLARTDGIAQRTNPGAPPLRILYVVIPAAVPLDAHLTLLEELALSRELRLVVTTGRLAAPPPDLLESGCGNSVDDGLLATSLLQAGPEQRWLPLPVTRAAAAPVLRLAAPATGARLAAALAARPASERARPVQLIVR